MGWMYVGWNLPYYFYLTISFTVSNYRGLYVNIGVFLELHLTFQWKLEIHAGSGCWQSSFIHFSFWKFKLLHKVFDCRFECLIGLNSWIELLINGGGPHSIWTPLWTQDQVVHLTSVESSQTGLDMGWVLSAPQGVMVWASLGTLYSALNVYESHAKNVQRQPVICFIPWELYFPQESSVK